MKLVVFYLVLCVHYGIINMNSAIDQLIEFGFEKESAELALRIADGDLEVAANLAASNTVE